MKISALLLLSTIFTLSLTVNAQHPSGVNAYFKWQDEVLAKQEQGYQTPHYFLGSVTRRIDANTAHVDFSAAGVIPEFTIEVQPIQFLKNSDGTFTQKKIGEKTTTSLKGFSDNSHSLIGGISLTAKVTDTTNALEVKWIINDGKGLRTITSIYQLESTPTENISSLILN